jgi:hypothetical protein
MDSYWALLKGYRKAAGKFLRNIGEPLENAKIPTVSQ